MPITIRKGNENDFAGIFSLIKEFAVFQKTPEKLTMSLEQMKEEKDFFQCMVAEDEFKGIVAFATFFFAYYSWSGKALYLDDLYVTADFRNKKIGTQLLEYIIDLAKQTNCKKLRWQVSNWNTEAKDFYKKMGATLDEVEINCDLDLRKMPV